MNNQTTAQATVIRPRNVTVAGLRHILLQCRASVTEDSSGYGTASRQEKSAQVVSFFDDQELVEFRIARSTVTMKRHLMDTTYGEYYLTGVSIAPR
jgi:hypothetical protein